MSREVRICENCGVANAIDKLECTSCGYDLSFVVPTLEGVAEKRWALKSNSGSVCSEIISGDIIGREGTVLAEYVNDSDYISRRHAQFSVEGGKLFVTDMSTNGTSVNGVRILKNEKTLIGENDEVAFADMAFKVSIYNAD